MYCNYNTTVLNTILLYVLADLDHIYLVLKCGYHSSFIIDFSTWQMDTMQLSAMEILLTIIMHPYCHQ